MGPLEDRERQLLERLAAEGKATTSSRTCQLRSHSKV